MHRWRPRSFDAGRRRFRGRPAPRDRGARLTRRYFVPGRIELLGKHTDYAGGRSLLCAVDRGFRVGATPRSDRLVRVVDTRLRVSAEAELDPALRSHSRNWVIYLEAVAGRIARNFPIPLRGADIEIESDLPAASGLSSSSALTVGLFLALADRNELWKTPEWAMSLSTLEDLAGYLGSVENGRTFRNLEGDEGVGTLSGNEDQTAILCSRPGEISQYRFCPIRRERSIALGPDWKLAVAASGVPSDKTGGVRERFNRLALSIAALRDLWNRETGRSEDSLFASLTRDPEEAARFRSLLRRKDLAGLPADLLLARLDQLVEESAEIVPRVGGLLERGDVAGTGPLVDRSQELAEKVLENQVAETVALQRSARSLGAPAASAFGGGFGGSVWALIETNRSAEFLRRWREEYAGAFPARSGDSHFFLTRPGGPAMRLGASGARPWEPGEA